MSSTRNPEETRKLILDSAIEEIHRKGFQAASVNDILADTGVTRGALYHHFPNKQALGMAVLDAVEESVVESWIAPLGDCSDPITCLQRVMRNVGGLFRRDDLVLGCPLNNLALEMSACDEEFRRRIVGIYDNWVNSIADAMRRGQSSGHVHGHVDPLSAAMFFVASITGGRGLAKTWQRFDVLAVCADSLARYLETLRA